MNGIISFWARNSVAANLLMVLCFIGGLWGYLSLEEEIFPQLQFNGASVSMAWQGASPSDIEDQIVIRIEEALVGIDGLERMTGSANEGFGNVWVEARDGVDMEVFVREVEQRVNQINNFPPSAFEPQVTRWRTNNQYQGVVIYGPLNDREMARKAEEIRDELSLLPGGELASVQATLPEQISIEIAEDALRRYNMTFDEVSNAIRRSSVNASGGTIRTENGTSTVEVRQRKDSAEEFGSIIIRQTTDAGTIRIRDVANVIDGTVDADLSVNYNGLPTALIVFSTPSEMHVSEYHEALVDFIDEFNARDDEVVELKLLWTEADFYNRLTGTIGGSAILGFSLVFLVLIMFLRPAVAFWVTIGVATSFAGAFAVMPFLGVSLNIMTLFAILLVIGILVDDAIIVGENIHSQVEAGHAEGVEAAITGTQLVLKPVIFGVITTMIMFAPWALIEGSFRSFTQQLTFVVVAALTFSLLEGLLILPAHLAHLKKNPPKGTLSKVQNAIADSLVWFAHNIYGPVLKLALKARYATATLFIFLFIWAMTLLSSGLVVFSAQPEIDNDMIRVQIELPDGTPYSRALEVREQLERGYNEADRILSERYPTFEEPFVTDVFMVTSDDNIEAYIGLMSPENRPEGLRTTNIGEVLREAIGPIPDAEEVTLALTFNDSGSGIRFALNSNDLDLLREAANDVKQQLATYETTYDISDNLTAPGQAIRLSLKPGAEALGVDLATISNQIRQAYFGDIVQRIQRDGEEVEVRVSYPLEDRRSIDSIREFRVRLPSGEAIPIDQVAIVEFGPGINRILRRERTRSVSVFAGINGDDRGNIMRDMNENFWPAFEEKFPTVGRGAIGGQQDESEFLLNIMWLNLGAIGLMYVMLAIAFKSYTQPLLLLMAVPFAFAGAAFGHLFFGVTMAMFSLFGIAAGAGVVINDNLVLMDNLNQRRTQGFGAFQATYDACTTRFRPILLTSITTFVGILPMIAERSIDAQFLKPMVLSLGCAVGFSIFVSLFFVPALYLIGVEIGRFFKWAWSGRPYRKIGETYLGDDEPDDLESGPRPAPAE